MRRLIGRRDFRCGAFSGFDAHSCQARFTSMNGHHQATSVGPKSANMRHRLDGQSPTNCFTLRLCRCCSLLQMPLMIRQQPGRAVAFGIMSMPVLGEMAKMKALAYAGKSPAER
jgi:hypothetical protein